MDSPLNRAHTFARKADALTAAGKFQEAICCHNRAAENVLETLMSPSLQDNPSVMSCLRQQHEHHLHQVKLLQGKQLRCANMEARRSRTVSMRSKAVQTEKQASTNHHTATSANDNVLVNTQNIEESIREADTLLQFLKLRKQGPGPDDQWQRYRMGMMYPDPAQSDSDVAVTAVKKPKGDKEIIEELRCLTSDLHIHIKQLVQESEWLKGENQRLSHKMQAKKEKKDEGGQQQQNSGSGGEGDEHDVDVDQLDALLPFHSHFSMASSFTLPPLDVPMLQQPADSDSDDDLSDRL